MQRMLYCVRCHKDKPDSEMKSDKVCLICAEKRSQYYQANKIRIKEKSKLYYEENKDKMLAWQKQYYEENWEERQQYNQEYYERNREELIKINALTAQERKKHDPIFKLRKRLSADIWKMLKKNSSSKKSSIIKHLSYTIQDLKDHLEKQFKPWMNWNNWGQYNKKTWNDNDQSTWTWSIDHIIPHSSFKYLSMSEQSFKDCWALDNLRPISSKENLKKGNRLD